MENPQGARFGWGFPSLSHWQVPACPARNRSSPWWQGSLGSHPPTPRISASQISQETGDKLETRRRRTRDSHSESCPLWESQALLFATSQLLGTSQAQSGGDKRPDFPPCGLFQRGCSSGALCPASHTVFSKCFLEREERAPVPAKGLRFSTSSQSAGAAALSSEEKVFPVPLSSWNQQHRECLRGAE